MGHDRVVAGEEELRGILVGSCFWRGRLARLGQAVEVEFVRVPLSVDFGHYIFVVVVAESPAQFVIVHVGLALPLAPPSGYFVRIGQFELSICTFPEDAGCV